MTNAGDALLDDIIANPARPDNYLLYADWLELDNDESDLAFAYRWMASRHKWPALRPGLKRWRYRWCIINPGYWRIKASVQRGRPEFLDGEVYSRASSTNNASTWREGGVDLKTEWGYTSFKAWPHAVLWLSCALAYFRNIIDLRPSLDSR